MSTNVRQQIHPNSGKNIFRKQKSIDLNDKPTSDSKKGLRKQLSVDHVATNVKHGSSVAPVNFNSFLWRNSTQSLNESNLRNLPSVVKKRAANSLNTSALSNRESSTDCISKTMKSVGEGTRTRVNINIFISQDVPDDLLSDNEGTSHAENQTHNKAVPSTPTNVLSKPPGNAQEVSQSAVNGRSATASARRAQFQASRRIMSAPIRPMNMMDDGKNKRKARKKKVIRDKDDFDDSPDELPEEVDTRKTVLQPQAPKAPSKAKQLTTRSRSVLGCDQMGIETLVSMLSSGGSDSEKEEAQQAQTPPATKPEASSRSRTNILRKTVSFQDDDSFLQPTLNKDTFNRRNSNVPFAGRMRNTRSLFGQEITNLYLPNSDELKSSETKNENDLNSTNKPNHDEAERSKPKKGSEGNSEDKKTQDIQTPKEQECWRLYEKMKKTGLNVSYDTILRGILKPSELRLLEKQKKYLGDIAEKSIDCQEAPSESQN